MYESFLWKLLLFHTEMLPAKFLWGSVLLRGELQKYAKNSNFENFQSALYSTSVSMPLSKIWLSMDEKQWRYDCVVQKTCKEWDGTVPVPFGIALTDMEFVCVPQGDPLIVLLRLKTLLSKLVAEMQSSVLQYLELEPTIKCLCVHVYSLDYMWPNAGKWGTLWWNQNQVMSINV